MTYEKSCGAVVFTREDGEIKYVLAQMLGGHYDFPKGHMEAGETEEDTALREIFEEVHLKPSLIPGFRCVMEYDIPTIDVHKQVVLFLGEYQNQKIIYQREELRSALTLSYDKAMEQLTYENSKRILRQAHDFLAGRKYYEAYDDRYRQIHSQNLQWFCDDPTPIVLQILQEFGITKDKKLLELGCGEGRDAYVLLQQGYDLLATDISPAAIQYAQKKWPGFAENFAVLDCIDGSLNEKFDFIYAVAVVHMLVENADRDTFYSFIRDHLNPGGIALVCTMGDGEMQRQTDIRTAFDLQERTHEQTGKAVQIASTSCRMVNFETLREELKRNGLAILKEGITSAPPDFSMLMYAVVKGETLLIYDSIVKREPVDKGWSGDRKYCVTTQDGSRYLLRITAPERAYRFHLGYLRMQEAAALGIPMCLPVEFGECPEGTYAVHSWIEGVDAEEYIPTLSIKQQYAYGLDAGHILKKLHSLPAPADATPWADRFNAKIDRKIKMYTQCPLKYEGGDLFLRFLAENRHLLSDRPQTYQHGDYHIGNMMVDEKGVLTIIDFDRDDFGDPWEEFNRIVWCAQAAPPFASGMVDGYFEGSVPMAFWRLLALYISSNTLSSLPWAVDFGEAEITTMRNQAAQVLRWYDNMQNPVPNWYRKEV